MLPREAPSRLPGTGDRRGPNWVSRVCHFGTRRRNFKKPSTLGSRSGDRLIRVPVFPIPLPERSRGPDQSQAVKTGNRRSRSRKPPRLNPSRNSVGHRPCSQMLASPAKIGRGIPEESRRGSLVLPRREVAEFSGGIFEVGSTEDKGKKQGTCRRAAAWLCESSQIRLIMAETPGEGLCISSLE
jgi:hypothetical protein